MTIPLGSATLTVNVAGIFNAPPMGIKGLVISNESPFNVQISLQGTAKGGTLLPETAAFFPIDRGFNGNVTYTPTSVITNPASYTAATLSFEVVGLNEPFDPSSYPIALTRPAVSSTATGKPLFTASFGVGSSANVSQFMSVYNPPNSGVSFTFHSFQAFTSDTTLPISYLVLVNGGDPNLTTPVPAVSHFGDVPSPVSFAHCTAQDASAAGFFTSIATLEPKNLPANVWTEFMTFPDNNTLHPGNALVLEVVSGVSGKTVRMTAKWSEDIAIAPQGGVPTGVVMTSIVNTGNPAPTPVVTGIVDTEGTDATLINNDGSMTMGNASHSGTIKLADAASGGAQPVLSANGAGAINLAALLSTQQIGLFVGATKVGHLDSGGIHLEAGGFQFDGSASTLTTLVLKLLTNGLTRIAIAGPFTVTSAGTAVSHGLGATPTLGIAFFGGTVGALHTTSCDNTTMTSTQCTLYSEAAGGITNIYLLTIKF
jgi:hypothetical protein